MSNVSSQKTHQLNKTLSLARQYGMSLSRLKELRDSVKIPDADSTPQRVRNCYALNLSIYPNNKIWGVVRFRDDWQVFTSLEFIEQIAVDVREVVDSIKWKFPIQKPNHLEQFKIAENLVDFWWPLNDSYDSFAGQCLSEFEDLLEVTEVGQA